MLSVIVPAHNEARLLGDTLAALSDALRAVGVEHETWVVDDASTDVTAEIARAAGARVLRVEYRHIAATRNAGARASSGERLLFLDADTQVDAPVLRAALRALDGGAVGGGAQVHLKGALRWHERASVPLIMWLLRRARIAPGCFLFCTRDAFDRVGGFDETLFAAEDVRMSWALARQGCFVLLRERVRTSARKLRTFSALDHLRLLARLAWHGPRLLRSREGLELWYGERRDEHERSGGDA